MDDAALEAESVRAVAWIPLVTLLVHMAEEAPRFPRWATRHFGATSPAWYAYSHALLVALAVWIAWRADAGSGDAPALLLPGAAQWALAVNALFHVAATLRFGAYSPGVISGVLFSLPATAYFFVRALSDGHLTSGQVLVAACAGTTVSALATASLWLQLDFDWKLRR